LLLAVAAWAAVVVLRLWPLHGLMLNWDEVDYAIAARAGIVANATDRGGLGAADFWRQVKAKQRGTSELPAGYDERADLLVRRHFHPPLVPSMVSVAGRVAGLPDERRVRAVQLVGALILTVMAAASYLHLAAGATGPGGIATIALAAWTGSLLFATLSCHGWQAVWISLCSLVLAGPPADPRPVRRGWAIGIPLALGLVTLETGALVAATALLGLYARGRLAGAAPGPVWRTIRTAAAVATSGLLLLWPASILKLSYARVAGLYAFRIAAGEEYARVPGHGLELAAALSPVLGLSAFALAYGIFGHRGWLGRWALPTAVALVHTAALARFAVSPDYLLPGLCALLPLIGVAVDELVAPWPGRKLAGWAVAAASVALVTRTAARVPDRERDDLEWLRGRLAGRSVLADGAHVYKYYLPGHDITAAEVSYDGRHLLRRESGRYTPLTASDVAGKTVVVQATREKFYERGESEYFRSCTRAIRPTLRLYDCPAE